MKRRDYFSIFVVLCFEALCYVILFKNRIVIIMPNMRILLSKLIKHFHTHGIF